MNMNHTISLAVIAVGILTSLPVERAGAQAQPTAGQMITALKQNLAESQKRPRKYEWIETRAAAFTAQTALEAKAKNILVVVDNSGHRPLAR